MYKKNVRRALKATQQQKSKKVTAAQGEHFECGPSQ